MLVAMLTLTITGPLPATAITGGNPDGDRHPNVALITFYVPIDGGTTLSGCSATLISPTVLLTAAHCAQGVRGKTLVTFQSVIAENRTDDPIPGAADPSIGYTPEELEAAGFLWGTSLAHPGANLADASINWYDVGIVVLSQPVTDITPATLAPVGYLDQFAQPVLNRTIFEVVGYGTEVRKPESGPQRPTPMLYPNFRRYTTSPGLKLTPDLLLLQGNPNDNRGGGGTCFGDSGGPVFLNGYLVAITSFGYTANCRYVDGYQRVDNNLTQDWLGGYL